MLGSFKISHAAQETLAPIVDSEAETLEAKFLGFAFSLSSAIENKNNDFNFLTLLHEEMNSIGKALAQCYLEKGFFAERNLERTSYLLRAISCDPEVQVQQQKKFRKQIEFLAQEERGETTVADLLTVLPLLVSVPEIFLVRTPEIYQKHQQQLEQARKLAQELREKSSEPLEKAYLAHLKENGVTYIRFGEREIDLAARGWKFECNIGGIEDNLSHIQEACKGKQYLLEPNAYDALGNKTNGFALYLFGEKPRVPEWIAGFAAIYLEAPSLEQEYLLKELPQELQKKEGEIYHALSGYETSAGTLLSYFADKMRGKGWHAEADMTEERIREFMKPREYRRF